MGSVSYSQYPPYTSAGFISFLEIRVNSDVVCQLCRNTVPHEGIEKMNLTGTQKPDLKMESARLHPWRYLFHCISRDNRAMWFEMLLYTLLVPLSSLAFAVAPKLVLDYIQAQNWQGIVTVIAIAALAASLGTWLQQFLTGDYRMRMNSVRYGMILDVGRTGMNMPFSNTETASTREDISLIMRTLGSPNAGPGLIMLKMLTLGASLIGLFGFTGILSELNPGYVAVLILFLALQYALLNRKIKYRQSFDEEEGHLVNMRVYAENQLLDFSRGKDIRIFRFAPLLLDEARKQAGFHIDLLKKIYRGELKWESLDAVVALVRDLALYGVLLLLLFQGRLEIGQFILYTGSLTSFIFWFERMAEDLSAIGNQLKYLKAVDRYVTLNRPRTDGRKDLPENPVISFRDLSFTYPGAEKPVLDHLNLELRPGQRIALVGENGAGKTTLIKLLTGLYQATNGSITLNDANLSDFDSALWQARFSCVFQDSALFAMTVAENVAMSLTPDRERVAGALKKAGLWDDISKLPNGMDTELLRFVNDGGVDLSGGQRQRLFLARALYQDRPLLILDEPTAALDPLAEFDLYTRFNELTAARTTVFISHRLSSTRFCDLIYFLENGSIREVGSHQDLMALGGRYAALFELQARNYRANGDAEANLTEEPEGEIHG